MTHSYGRIVFILLGVGVAVYACWKISQRVDAFLYPWADERAGRPVLTGAWVGQLKTLDGPLVVKLELHRWKPPRKADCSNCNTIIGTAATCDGEGASAHYQVSGKPVDRTATHINLTARPADDFVEGLQLSELRGSWRSNELALEAKIDPPEAGSDGKMHSFVALPMQRAAGDELDLLCQRIAEKVSRK